MHDQHVGAERHQADRLEIPDCVVRDPCIEAGVGNESGAGEEQRVTVFRRFANRFGPDVAVGAAAIFDNERLAEVFGEFGGQEAAGAVDAAAGREGHHDAHGAGRIMLR